MSSRLINRSKDLLRLRNEGFEVEVRGGHLLVHHIPYVNSGCELKYGTLVSTLRVNNDSTLKPDTHVIHFIGEHPCQIDGMEITYIKNATQTKRLFDNVVINCTFSNKPPQGYVDYFEKITRYVELISAPAVALDATVTAKTFKVIECDESESVFNYLDTNSSRANIDAINDRFKGHRIGIIGLGGTGSYILDMVAKTPVDEILLFDSDEFLLHNAFRAPGAPSVEVLNQGLKKVDYFTSIYSNMRRRIVPHAVKITSENIELLKGLSFVFISVDSNSARSVIISALLNLEIPFVDVGLGVQVVEDTLSATLRCTTGTPDKSDHLEDRIGSVDAEDDAYASNIQIADLNAMNALLAVLKWKRYIGFYRDLKGEHETSYTVNTGQLLNDEFSS
jgi:hypothetical protein